ncbi:MAG TPA: M43 family zinc metalloprotease [Candidatus Eisenbacteria bacterium]
MKRLMIVLALLAIALFALAPLTLAAGRPAAGPPSWANSENGRVADNGDVVYRCGTEARGRIVATPDQAQIDRWINDNRIQAGGVIRVNFHVIYTSRRGTTEGNVPESQLDAQIAVLNNNYAGKDYNGNPVSGAANTGYTFVKGSVTRTLSSKWFGMTPGTRAERDAKNTLAVNWTSELNLYTCKPGQNLLGWSTFPWDLATNGKQDGVVIHYGSLPGGYLSPYNLGGTASHEIGHWVGLYHTFQGGCDTGSCSTTGDNVCDTPAEATATSGCPTGKDTCPATGLDPIHNYMDYSTDICYNQFTTGQDARADFMMSTYRPLIGSARLANAASSMRNARDLGAGLVEFRAVPNPFNPRTKIEFGMAREGRASIRVFDVQGRLISTVLDGRLPAGNHSVDFDGARLSSGVYWMVLKTDDAQATRRISLLK